MISRRSLSINAKYAVSEVVEIPVPVSDSLQDLNVVVHSFGKGVGIAVFKRVENWFTPIVHCRDTVLELRDRIPRHFL